MDADRLFKDAVYAQVARLGRAVSHPRRLELLDLLCQGPMTVDALAHKGEMTIANCSQHLQHLKAAGLVRAEVRGSSRVYRLADPATCELVRLLNQLAQRYYAELRDIYHAFMKDLDGVEAITLTALRERVSAQSVVVVDVRPEEEYAAGHLPGAVSVPYHELAQRLSELPKDVTIVAYCRGPFCVLSLHAVEALQAAGLSAVRLDEGVTDWRGRFDLLEEDVPAAKAR